MCSSSWALFGVGSWLLAAAAAAAAVVGVVLTLVVRVVAEEGAEGSGCTKVGLVVVVRIELSIAEDIAAAGVSLDLV